jgi:hypothetical protein
MIIGMKTFIVIFSLLFAATASAELFKWIDQDGVIHYSDKRPAETATQQELSGYLVRLANKKQDEEDTENLYSTFNITQPENDSIIRKDGANINFKVQIDPPLTEKHFLQIYLDGLELGKKTRSTELRLQRIKKGMHRLQARIVDMDGQIISTTDEITFQFRKAVDLSKIAPNLTTPAQ